MRFLLNSSTVAKLEAIATVAPYSDDVIEPEHAVMISAGLGPAIYLTLDGRVIEDRRSWDDGPMAEAEPPLCYAALVVAAERFTIPELLELLPKAPSGSARCIRCDGTRWFSVGIDSRTQQPGRIVCPECSGLGWVA
jgi:hypothetical protein